MKKFKIAALSLFWSVATFAANNSKMVWETPAEDISKSVSGPMAKVIALVVIVASAFGWVITENSGIMGKIIRIVIALAVVGGASVLLGLFNITGVVETLQITNSILGQISTNISQLGLLSETANKAQAMSTNTDSQEMENSKVELENAKKTQKLNDQIKMQELINKSKKSIKI